MALSPTQLASLRSTFSAIEPQPFQEEQEEEGILDSIGGAAMDTLRLAGTVLDSLGRPARTLLGTGDIGRSLDSIFNPEQALSESQLLEQYGITAFDQGEGFDLGDVADFALRFGVGVATDPMTYLSGGLTTYGKGVVGAGKQAARMAKTKGLQEAAAFFTKATGKPFDRKLFQYGMEGLENTLAGRIKAGEAGLQVGIPFTNVSWDLASQPLGHAMEGITGILGKGMDAFGRTTVGTPAVRWATRVKNLVSETTGSDAMDMYRQLGEAAGFNAARSHLPKIHYAIKGMADAGIDPKHFGMMDEYAQLIHTDKDVARVAEMIGAPLPETIAKRREDVRKITGLAEEQLPKRHRTLDDLEKEIRAAGYGDEQIEAIARGANTLHHFYDDVLKAEQAVEKNIGMLGNKVLDDLDRSKKALLEEIKARTNLDELSHVGKSTEGSIGEVFRKHKMDDFIRGADQHGNKVSGYDLDVTAFLKEHDAATKAIYGDKVGSLLDDLEVGALAKDYEEMTKLASTLPSYAFHRVSDEAAEILLKKANIQPEQWRKMLNTHGEIATTVEANEIVRMAGTTATGGRRVPKILTVKEAVNAIRSGGVDEVKKASEFFGDYFKVDPHEIAGERLQSLANAVSKKEYSDGIRQLFTEELPAPIRSLWARVGKAEKEFAKAKKGFNQKTIDEAADKLRKLKAQYDEAIKPEALGGKLPEGYVMADKVELGLSGMQGRMIKGAVDEGTGQAHGLAKMIMDQQKMVRDPELYKGVMKPLHAYNRLFKSWSLGWPGTTIRNKIGNYFLRLQGGGMDAKSALDEVNVGKLQMMMSRQPGTASNLEKTTREMRNLKFDAGPAYPNGLDGKELSELAYDLGVIDNGFWALEFKTDIAEQLGKKTLVSRLDLPGKLKIRKVNEFFENGDKMGMFLARLRAGDTPEQAAYLTNKFLFNYRVVSPAVNVLRRAGVMPFAAWSSKNIPLQLQLMAEKPGQFAALIHAKSALESGVPGVNPDELPEWVSNKLGVKVAQNEDGSIDFRLLTGVIPMADLPTITDPAEFFGQLLGPVPKTIIEQISNKNTFTKRKISEFDGQLSLIKPLGTTDSGFFVHPRIGNVIENLAGRPYQLIQRAGQMYEEYDATKGWYEQAPTQLVTATFNPLPQRKIASRRELVFADYALARQLGAAKRARTRFEKKKVVEGVQRMDAIISDLEDRLKTIRQKKMSLAP